MSVAVDEHAVIARNIPSATSEPRRHLASVIPRHQRHDFVAVEAHVEGQVQRVGYRVFVGREAGRLHLDGWVRNRFDGTVEILVSGPNAAVETFVGLCMRGPSSARVTDVEMHKAEPPADGSRGGLVVAREHHDPKTFGL